MFKKVLIVEDDQSLAKALKSKFVREKFLVSLARNGAQGLELALKEKPEMILLDIIMPVMDGMTMLDKLRKDKWGKNAKVIILTNLNEAEKVSQAMKDGVYDFLVKTDWKLDEVVKKVREKLKQ